MAGYITHIKVGSGEAWPIQDPNALPKSGGTIAGNPLVHTTDETNFASYAGTSQGAVIEAYRDKSNLRRQFALNNMESVSDIAEAVQFAQTSDGVSWQTYRLYGEHNKPSPADIGAVSSDEIRVKTYTSLAQLSIETATTTDDVFKVMPAGSMLALASDSASTDCISDAPVSSANVVLFKTSEKCGHGFAASVDGSRPRTYMYNWHEDDANNCWYLPGIGMDLLWENASPTSNYGDATFPEISLDLSDYKAVFVEFKAVAGTATSVCTNIMVPINNNATGNTYETAIGFTHVYCKQPGKHFYNRYLRASTTGVVISEGREMTTFDDTSYSIDNSLLIPTRIYGIQ